MLQALVSGACHCGMGWAIEQRSKRGVPITTPCDSTQPPRNTPARATDRVARRWTLWLRLASALVALGCATGPASWRPPAPDICAKTETLVVQNGTEEPFDIYLIQGAQDARQVLLGTAGPGRSEYRLPAHTGDGPRFQARVPPSTAPHDRPRNPRRERDLVFKVECH